MTNTIYASFSDPEFAQRAAKELVERGLKQEDLSFVGESENPNSGGVPGYDYASDYGSYVGASEEIEANRMISEGDVVPTAPAGMEGTPGYPDPSFSNAIDGDLHREAAYEYLTSQGVDERAAIHFNKVVTTGGAVIAISVPSGTCDEECAREVLEECRASFVRGRLSSGYMA